MSEVKVWSLTVDRVEGSIVTTVHGSEQACLDDLEMNYLQEEDEAAEAKAYPEGMVQFLIDTQGMSIYIDEHTVDIAEESNTP